MIVSKVINRLNLSDDFWVQFGVQDKTLQKHVGFYEIESIDNPNIITISINPKEYFEKYRDKRINKKHKGLKRDTPGMDFEAYYLGCYFCMNLMVRVLKKFNKKDFRSLTIKCK